MPVARIAAAHLSLLAAATTVNNDSEKTATVTATEALATIDMFNILLMRTDVTGTRPGASAAPKELGRAGDRG